MSVRHRPVTAQDVIEYLRSYHADSIDGSEPVEEVWDRYHLPDGTHRVNGQVWDRKKILGSLRARRSLRAPHVLHIHEVTVEGRRAAVRYTVGTPMVGKIHSATEAAALLELAQDGRVADSYAFSATRPGWSAPDRAQMLDSEARPASGLLPAPPPAAGEEPTPAQDPGHYLRAYHAAGYDPEVPVAEAHDRFHTPDALHHVARRVMQRSGVLRSLEDGRRRGHTYPVDVHETLREGNRFAARYTTSRDGNPARPQEILVFGDFAPDGRVRQVRFALNPGYGAA